MKTITCDCGQPIKVDDQDFEKVEQLYKEFFWCCENGRIYTTKRVSSTETIKTNLSNLIISAKHGEIVDHIYHDRHDLRRNSLRVVTKAQNCQNRQIASNNTSGYKGVSFNKSKKCWEMKIGVNGKRLFKGGFETVLEAAKEYNNQAMKHHGPYALLNTISSDNSDE